MTLKIEPDTEALAQEMIIRPRMNAMVKRRHEDARAKGFNEPIAWASWSYQGVNGSFPIYPDHHDPDRRRDDGSP